MPASLARTLSIALAALLIAPRGLPAQAPPAAEPGRPGPATSSSASSAFVSNAGQWPPGVRFRADNGGQTSWLLDDGWVLACEERRDAAASPTAAAEGTTAAASGVAVRMRFLGCRPRAPRGEGLRAERRHYFTGDATLTDVPAWDSVRWPRLYAGIDVVGRQQDGHIEYDVCLRPGADVSDVVVRCEGVEDIELGADGALLLHTALGPLRQAPPLTWQELPGEGRRVVSCRYRRLDARHFGFELPDALPGLSTIIDPGLEWASFLGGSSFEAVQAVALDASGELTVAGFTSAGGFPLTPGSYDAAANGGRDVFVSRFSADGSTLLWSTLIGGADDEEARAVALDAAGGVVLAGWTASSNFPATPGCVDSSFNGGAGVLDSDAFVARLSPGGDALVFATYLGGAQEDLASALALDAAGNVHVAGKTSSAGFPATAGAFDTSYNGGTVDVGDAFAACLPADGSSLLFATFLGGSGDEFANAIAVDDDGRATLAGWTASVTYPTTDGAFDRILAGTSDAFVTRLAPGGAALQFSTLLGGGQDENATSLALTGDGGTAVAGTTLSGDFPVTPGALLGQYSGGTWYGDAFVARLDAAGAALLLGGYLGGAGDDFPTGLAPDAAGDLVVAGWTGSPDVPVTPDAADATLGGSTDALLAVLDGASGVLQHATYLGGSSPDKVLGLALAPDGRLALAGHTSSGSFPVTTGAYDTQFDGVEGIVSDGFAATIELDLLPSGAGPWQDLGFGLPGTSGVQPDLQATGTLLPLSSGVVLLTGGAPLAGAVLFVSTQAGAQPFMGGTLLPFPYESLLTYVTDALGGIVIPFTWPASVAPGHTLYAQAWIVDGAAPKGLSASNALSATAP